MSAALSASTIAGLQPGSIVGNKYRIDGLLGEGGMGLVFSATHLELDAPVAIKVVRDELAKHEEIASRLLFEARAVARMRGTHIVRILDVARLPSGAPYFVMERLHGQDLGTLITERGSLPVSASVEFLIQTCEALNEAHALGIVHRDLKPENLFLANTPEGVVLKVLDFGISKYLGNSLKRGPRSTLTKAGAAVGSPYYMSPEQMRASPDLDARADIWSLGAILFEALTGHCPFESESNSILCSKVMVDPAPSLREYLKVAPAALDAIIHRCLEKEPAARFQSSEELGRALRNYAAHATEYEREATTASGVELSPEAPHRDRWTIPALIAVCVLLVGTAAAAWRYSSDSGKRSVASLDGQVDQSFARHPPPPLPLPAPEPSTLPRKAKALPMAVAPAAAAALPPKTETWPVPLQPPVVEPMVPEPVESAPLETAVSRVPAAPIARPAAPLPPVTHVENAEPEAARYGL